MLNICPTFRLCNPYAYARVVYSHVFIVVLDSTPSCVSNCFLSQSSKDHVYLGLQCACFVFLLPTCVLFSSRLCMFCPLSRGFRSYFALFFHGH
jgi:hypothetical protein